MAKKAKRSKRTTTSLVINKEDLEAFNKLRAKETGRRGASVSQQEFIKFLQCLYQEVDECVKGGIIDATLLHDAERRAAVNPSPLPPAPPKTPPEKQEKR